MADRDRTRGGKVDELRGKAQEGVGRATGDEEMRREGRGRQVKGNVKQAADKAKDALRSFTGKGGAGR